jgi:hypothetical protein
MKSCSCGSVRRYAPKALTRAKPVGIWCYHPYVAARKLSVALEEPVAHAAKQAAERRGISLSAWMNEASRNALSIENGLAAVAEWEAEHGPLTPSELAAAAAKLDAAVVGHSR